VTKKGVYEVEVTVDMKKIEPPEYANEFESAFLQIATVNLIP